MVWWKQLQSTRRLEVVSESQSLTTYGYQEQDLVDIETCKQRPVKECECRSWRYRVDKVATQLSVSMGN